MMGTHLTRARSTENSDELPWHLSFVVNATSKKNIPQLTCQTSATFFTLFAANRMDTKSCCLQWKSATVGVRLDGKNMLAFIQQNPVWLERQILSPPQSSHPASPSSKAQVPERMAIQTSSVPPLSGSLIFLPFMDDFMMIAWCFRTAAAATKCDTLMLQEAPNFRTSETQDIPPPALKSSFISVSDSRP